MIVKGIIGHIVIDQQPQIIWDAAPDKRDQVAVMNPADDLYLGLELPLGTAALDPELLYSDGSAI